MRVTACVFSSNSFPLFRVFSVFPSVSSARVVWLSGRQVTSLRARLYHQGVKALHSNNAFRINQESRVIWHYFPAKNIMVLSMRYPS